MKHRSTRLGGVLVACGSLGIAALLGASPVGAQTAGIIARESVDSLGGELNGFSGAPSVSSDGRWVAFASGASDLVPNDTNQNTDIFVRDRATGVVQRVSVAWNGMEARDDSACPSISDDGRWVAFLSRAWNLYPGGANLGITRWDVYLHDRQEGTTTRINVSTSGGDPDAGAWCPSISGDGKRVVFASPARNLVGVDTLGWSNVFLFDRAKGVLRRVTKAPDGAAAMGHSEYPVISKDGSVVAFASYATNLVSQPAPVPASAFGNGESQIFARDLEAGITEPVSVSYLTGGEGSAQSWRPALSADGRYVAFESRARNLVPQPLSTGSYVFVRDRVAETTIVAGEQEPPGTDCGLGGEAFFCGWGNSHEPAISGDGRFVAFSSGSMRLLPANVDQYGSRIYLFDRIGGRLRRLSVDASGWQGHACSEEAELSGDGKLLLYRSAASNLVPGDENSASDVFSHEWTCNEAGRCRTLAACPSEPPSCEPAVNSVLRLRKRPPGGVHEDRLFWRWTGAGSAEPFPDPAGEGTYQLCLYAKPERALSLDVAAPEAPACAGSGRPCWRTVGAGYKLVDPNGGLTSLTLAATPSRRRILARGQGILLDAPYLPLDGSQGLVLQLHETGSERCWGAEFPATSIQRNIAGLAEAGSRRDGRLAARIP